MLSWKQRKVETVTFNSPSRPPPGRVRSQDPCPGGHGGRWQPHLPHQGAAVSSLAGSKQKAGDIYLGAEALSPHRTACLPGENQARA